MKSKLLPLLAAMSALSPLLLELPPAWRSGWTGSRPDVVREAEPALTRCGIDAMKARRTLTYLL